MGSMSPASAAVVLTMLNASLGYAVEEGWIRRNPASGIELPKAKGEPVIFLTYPELDSLIDAAREHGTASDAALIAVMGNIGIRPGEAAALTIQDVNLTTRRIHISKTVTVDEDNKAIVGDTPKTDAGIRDVPIPPHLIDDLAALIADREPTAPLFTSPTGSALNLANFRYREWRRATEAAGSPLGLTLKGLRHTAASLAIGAGADVLVVQRMLGHASASETLNTYAKLWPDRLDEVTEAMSQARSKEAKRARERAERAEESAPVLTKS